MRTVRTGFVVAAVASALVAGQAAAQGPIKIGFLSPMSGAIAAAGKDMYSGCELYWQESGWQIAGRKLEVILEDNEGLPATALTKLRKLVESDHVHVVAGVILSNVAYALVPYIEAQGIPTLYPINSADDLTQRRRPKWLIRTGLPAGGTSRDEPAPPPRGDESPGVVRAPHYSASLDTPANPRFRAAFEKAYNRTPSFYSENCYTGARIISEAVRAIGGKVEDRAALMGALRQVEITDAPRGPVKMDPYGNPTQNVYIRKVERVGGRLQNTVIHTYTAVSQFWKYDPEEFLKQPVYSRDFPPCRHC